MGDVLSKWSPSRLVFKVAQKKFNCLRRDTLNPSLKKGSSQIWYLFVHYFLFLNSSGHCSFLFLIDLATSFVLRLSQDNFTTSNTAETELDMVWCYSGLKI